MEVRSPARLEEALRLKAEWLGSVPIQGGTDVMVAVNQGRLRPPSLLDLSRVPELGGLTRSNGGLRLGSSLTYAQLMKPPPRDSLPALAEAARTVGSPQIRNRGTIGGGLATAAASWPGDVIAPLLVEDAEVEVASVRGSRLLPVLELLPGSRRSGGLAADELIVAVHVRPSGARQTFMKVGPRNAMSRAVVSLALAADPRRDLLRAGFGSSGLAAGLIEGSLADAGSLPHRVADNAQPVDDVRASAAYRRHALRVLTARALERCLP